MKEPKWKLRADSECNQGCPPVILLDMTKSDLTDALDMLEETAKNWRTDNLRADKINNFLNKFK